MPSDWLNVWENKRMQLIHPVCEECMVEVSAYLRGLDNPLCDACLEKRRAAAVAERLHTKPLAHSPEYRELHRNCPQCGARGRSRTLMGCSGTEDFNRVGCSSASCGWSGIVHQLVP